MRGAGGAGVAAAILALVMCYELIQLIVEQRLARSKSVMDALLTWAETKSAAVPKSALGKALYYLREQWPYLIRFLGDGQLEIFNNRAERSVKPFVMSRKN